MITDISGLTTEQIECVLNASEMLDNIPKIQISYNYRSAPFLVSKIVLNYKMSKLPIKDFARRIHINDSNLLYFSQGKYIDGSLWKELIYYIEKSKSLIKNTVNGSDVINYNDLHKHHQV